MKNSETVIFQLAVREVLREATEPLSSSEIRAALDKKNYEYTDAQFARLSYLLRQHPGSFRMVGNAGGSKWEMTPEYREWCDTHMEATP